MSLPRECIHSAILIGTPIRPVHLDFTPSSSALHNASVRSGTSKLVPVKFIAAPWVRPLAFLILGLAAAAIGIRIGETDEAPGAALLGLLLMLALVFLAIRSVRRQRKEADP